MELELQGKEFKMRLTKTETVSGIIQISYDSDDKEGLKKERRDLRKKGYKVFTSDLGMQVTQYGKVHLKLITAIPKSY